MQESNQFTFVRSLHLLQLQISEKRKFTDYFMTCSTITLVFFFYIPAMLLLLFKRKIIQDYLENCFHHWKYEQRNCVVLIKKKISYRYYILWSRRHTVCYKYCIQTNSSILRVQKSSFLIHLCMKYIKVY